MIDIYEIDQFGQWTGSIDHIGEGAGCSDPWVRASKPPEFGEGEAVVWAIGRWHVRSRLMEADLAVDPPPET
jgi:hypothetical protein